MKNKIIAVDFDGTLCEDKYPDIGAPRLDVIQKLIKEQQAGARVILWTCRRGEYLLAAIYWCLDNGLAFEAVNDNLADIIEKYHGDTRKIYADEYWDDRGVTIGNPAEREEQPDIIKEFEAEREKAKIEAERESAKRLIKKLLISITSHRDFLNLRVSSVGVYNRARAQGLAQAVEELESVIKFIEVYATEKYGLTASECNVL